MAQRHARVGLNAPRFVALVVSLALVMAACLSLRFHLPIGQGFVASHRFWIAVAGYGVLASGVLLPRR